jgi:catechol 2,3-dioxygenase-like lactoylglutathione lyase family enzyme
MPGSGKGGAMAVQLNHTIVRVRDKRESATFLAEVLGLGPPVPFGPFLVVEVDNQVSLDFADDHGPVHPQHYAFLVGEDEFDQIFGRIRDRDLAYWADPGRRRAGQINTNDGGRGVYWEEPSGHFLEIITRPYGSGP